MSSMSLGGQGFTRRRRGRGKRDNTGAIFPRPKPSPEYLANLMTQMSITEDKMAHTFDEMNLNPNLLKGVHSMGYETPAGIQKDAVMPGIRGRDLIMQAQSGMGKTAAMLLVVLQRIDINLKKPQALILVPTRELALQILAVIKILGQHMKVKSMACIGGRSIKNEIQSIGTTQIIVCTLGRIANHLDPLGPEEYRPLPSFNGLSLKTFVIDEADKMLTDYSFRVDLRRVFAEVSGDAQLILMSATMPQTAKRNAAMICRNPAQFLINNSELTLEGIRQFHVNVGNSDDDKVDAIAEILPLLEKKWTFIFCNTRKRVDDLCGKLIDKGLAVVSVQGLKSQVEREKILKDFENGHIRALISSDLHGRGIDIQYLSVVINYDLPEQTQYIHRVGRGGRYGRKGTAITYVTEKEMRPLKIIEEFYKTEIPEMPADINLILDN